MNREVHGNASPARRQTTDARATGTSRVPTPATPTRPPVETHWTRLLHCDLFNGNADEAHLEAPRGTRPLRGKPRRHGAHIAVRVAAYVAAAGLAHVLVPHATATTQRLAADTAATAIGAPANGAHVDESSAIPEHRNAKKWRQSWV